MLEIVEKVTPVVMECAEKLNLEIVDIEWVKEGGEHILRILADTEEGLTIEESAALNEMVGNRLDELDLIVQEYMLEVSSPGLEAPIKTEEQLQNALGEYIYIKCYSQIDKKKEFEGTLKNITVDTVEIEVNIKGRTKDVIVERNNIATMRYAVKF